MKKGFVTKAGAVILAAGMLLSGMPVCAASTKTAKTAKAAATATSGLSKRDKASAKAALGHYLNGDLAWAGEIVNGDYTYYSYAADPELGMPAAPNPMFAVADLNADGVWELYTNPGIGNTWACILLDGSSYATEDAGIGVTGYSPAVGAWINADTNGFEVLVLQNMNGYYFEVIMEASYSGGSLARVWIGSNESAMSVAQAQAYAAAFPSIATYVAPIVQPLNAATINAYFK